MEISDRQLSAALARIALPPDVAIRPWMEADFPAIQASDAEGWPTPRTRPDEARAAWRQSRPALVATTGTDVIAFVRALTDGEVTMFIPELLVAPAGQGVGPLLGGRMPRTLSACPYRVVRDRVLRILLRSERLPALSRLSQELSLNAHPPITRAEYSRTFTSSNRLFVLRAQFSYAFTIVVSSSLDLTHHTGRGALHAPARCAYSHANAAGNRAHAMRPYLRTMTSLP